ncbi:hypothetical protein EZS27_017171 [termite gut metagenome]|uniref:Uncharacterized protein n=1 Tax=termite gut metagenome TaxID=433724 RepID=A0A5J4RLJ0_9ZZZZ
MFNTINNHLIGLLFIFCYIFSFYIVGPITSSLIIALSIIICCGISSIYKGWLSREIENPFTIKIFFFQFLLIFVGLFYSIIHLSFDYSYIKVLFTQQIHFIAGIFIVIYLKNRLHVSSIDVEKHIVYAFLIQSIIQLVASVSPSFASVLLLFSRANELQEAYGGGVRGLALSSGTGWSLGLSYGLVYIIFVKRFLLYKIGILEIIIGILLLAGTFFAGRTGFVGAAIGGLFFILNNRKSFILKLFLIIKSIFFIVIFCIFFYLLFPILTNHLIEHVFPFAFEPFYKLAYNDSFSTGSTDTLLRMWSVPISFIEIFCGTGYFTDPITDTYFMRVDVGVLRNLFYWGIGGYLLVIIYQIVLIQPIRYIKEKASTSKYNMILYQCAIILYLFLLELKAMTIGFNKMTFSIVFLLSYFYFEDYRNSYYNAK